MTEILKALDALTTHVLAYRPKGKGEAAAKVAKKIEREERRAKKDVGGVKYIVPQKKQPPFQSRRS